MGLISGFSTKDEKPVEEVRRGIEPEEVEELDGDEAVALLSVSVGDFSLEAADGLRREDTWALRTWRRPRCTWLLIEDCSLVELRVRELEEASLLTKRKFRFGMANDQFKCRRHDQVQEGVGSPSRLRDRRRSRNQRS